MKNKALSTFMATALTATLVLPVAPVNAASSDSSVNQSIQIGERLAATKTKVPAGDAVTITNITKDKVRTSNGQYNISDSLKSLFKTANSTALTNAQATIVVKKGEITSVTSLTLKKAGTNKKTVYFDGGDAKIEGSLTVDADYVKVENVAIEDELIVTSRVKKSFSLDKVTIGDGITFKPLTARKINWLNVSLNDVKSATLNVERTKVDVSSNQTISTIKVVDKVAAFEVSSNVNELIIDVDKDFSLYGEGKIEQITVSGGAKVALDSGHIVTKVQVDDSKASVTLPVANKTELNKLLTSPPYVSVSAYGNDVLTTEKWTTQTDRNAFETAVTNARAVANNASASHEQVNNALTQYKTALANYQAVQKNGTKYGYGNGDKTSLQNLINSVQYVTVSWDGNNIYNTPWTTQAERDAIERAVASAQAVVNNYYATQNDISNAIYNLNNAITTYTNAQRNRTAGYGTDKTSLQNLINSVQYVTVSWEGNNLYNTPWTTQAERDAIERAVASAQAVVNNYYATQNDISNAIYNLNNAITTYTNAQRNRTNGYYGDKTSLQALINSVQYVAVSNNGYYSTPWTYQYEKDALVSAVASAQAVVNNYYSNYIDIQNATNLLNDAISTYKNAYKYW
ncbi:S-layer protein [Lysinibacillus pakistanensis]|uniref:S-layer protein n=1 Tax=Lysinibacillus pakistanensis TaxID=759811 RepID=UPI003D2D0DD5